MTGPKVKDLFCDIIWNRCTRPYCKNDSLHVYVWESSHKLTALNRMCIYPNVQKTISRKLV